MIAGIKTFSSSSSSINAATSYKNIKSNSIQNQSGSSVVSAPIDREAAALHTFVEARMLHRDVTITVESATPKSIVATVLHPSGNIAELLLQRGLARILEWSVATITSPAIAASLRAAELNAKNAKLHTWAITNNNDGSLEQQLFVFLPPIHLP
jgi:Staphylococcal nuclease homologue